jgi:2-keto-3-deoxy-L-rhamnonate aldolase RhmA
MMDVQQQIAAACQKHGKAWGRPVGTAADAKTLIDLGAQFIVLGSEFGAVHSHLSACAADFDSVLS